MDASLAENASTKPTPSKNPPLQIMPMMQQRMSEATGISISISAPSPSASAVLLLA